MVLWRCPEDNLIVPLSVAGALQSLLRPLVRLRVDAHHLGQLEVVPIRTRAARRVLDERAWHEYKRKKKQIDADRDVDNIRSDRRTTRERSEHCA